MTSDIPQTKLQQEISKKLKIAEVMSNEDLLAEHQENCRIVNAGFPMGEVGFLGDLVKGTHKLIIERMAPLKVGDPVRCILKPMEGILIVQRVQLCTNNWWWVGFAHNSEKHYPAKWYEHVEEETVLEEVHEIEKAS